MSDFPSNVKYLMPQSYTIEVRDGIYYAEPNIRGVDAFRGSDYVTVVQDAIESLPGGTDIWEGKIFHKRGTYEMEAGPGLLLGKATMIEFENWCRVHVQGDLTAISPYTDPAVFTIADSDPDYGVAWGIICDGFVYIRQSETDAGTNRYNGHGIYAEHAAEQGFRCQEFLEGLWFQNTKELYSSIELMNAMKLSVDRIKLRTYGMGMHFTTDGSISAFGNSLLRDIVIGIAAVDSIGMYIEGNISATERALNLTEFGRVQIGGTGSALAGQIALKIKDDGWIRFNMLNLEGGMIGVELEDAIFVDFGSVFGRVTVGSSKLFHLTGSTYGIHVDHLYGSYPAEIWDDDVASAYQYDRRNIIGELHIEGVGTMNYGRNTVLSPGGIMTVVFHTPTQTAADSVWSNMPTANSPLFGQDFREAMIDLRHFHSCRLLANVVVAGSTGSILHGQYSLNGSTWVSGLMAGTMNPQVPIDATGLIMSDWDDASFYAFAAGAKAGGEVYIRIGGYNGDGVADPEFGLIAMQFR